MSVGLLLLMALASEACASSAGSSGWTFGPTLEPASAGSSAAPAAAPSGSQPAPSAGASTPVGTTGPATSSAPIQSAAPGG